MGSGGTTMETLTENLERKILNLYRQACRQGRDDVAEHLLCALETLDQNCDNHSIGARQSTLAAAYRELTLPVGIGRRTRTEYPARLKGRSS
jgi:hypothetical protein